MRVLFLAALAVLILSSPTLASERGGGGHRPPPGPPPGCGGGCNGGGHRPPGGNINVNVNANASASAFASAGSYINARTYSSGVFNGGYGGGGTIITGGGYGGEGYGYGHGCGGCGPVYVQDDGRSAWGHSMPFGYRVQGFGRAYRHPAWIGRSGGGGDCCAPRDDRYGREGGHDRGDDRGHDRDWDRDQDYGRGRGDCDCRGGRDDRAEYRSESGYGGGSTYRSEEVRYEEFYGDLPPPDAPPMQAPPRQYYAREPGERG